AFVLFVVATVLAILLPAKVDSSQGEITLALGPGPSARASAPGRPARPQVPPAVAFALRANCGPRWLSGFLIMFMAFLLRENPIGDWRTEVLLGIVLGAAGIGNTLGIAVGSTLRKVNPPLLVVLALGADAVVVLVSALFYGVVTLGLLGLTAGLAQSLAKLALDATIQRDVPERVQSSAFARSDTTLQLAWVIGGFVGIAMPLHPHLGLGVACAVLAAWFVLVVVRRPAGVRTA
ncbi:MAG: MFS transporter, partial [Nocardioides sp.]